MYGKIQEYLFQSLKKLYACWITTRNYSIEESYVDMLGIQIDIYTFEIW